jgi:signal transduction histidine kinase
MLAFMAVILLIAGLVNVVNYSVVTARMDETIGFIYDYETGNTREDYPPGKPGRNRPAPGQPDKAEPPGGPPAAGNIASPGSPFMGLPDVEENYMTRFFVVRFDQNGEIESTSMDYVASVDSSGAKELADKVMSGGKDKGYIKDFRYAKKSMDDSEIIIFLNAGRELEYMASLRNLTLAVSLVSLLLVFILVVLLSNRAIRPIANNISRQKQFITDASHELKTPLTSISTSLDVIAMEHGEDEWTENIKNQIERMNRLVSELVQLSRLDEELPLPAKEHFSLSSTAEEIAEVFRPQAKALEKNLSTEIRKDVNILGDKAAVQQLMSVLLDNAVKYSDANGDIRFSVYKKRNKAVIEVFNTCRFEVPPDTDKLFDRFYRPDSSRSTETGGNGVGLAIAKAVAEAHGGRITASCPSGKTMTIRVVL